MHDLPSLHARLGLVATELAHLVGVSMEYVYIWKRKATMPQLDHVAAIVASRAMNKSEAHARIANLRKRLVPTKTKCRMPARRKAKRHAS